MKPKLVFATRNQGKIKELKILFVEYNEQIEILSLGDIEVPEVVEDGNTFLENATKKALETSQFTGLPALADDSGLVVDALDGAPGIYSARYAGIPSNDQKNNLKLLKALDKTPPENRRAHYYAALVFSDTQSHLKNKIYHSWGACQGRILTAPKGDGGFGYDPLFFLPKFGKTFAEMSENDKIDLTHRAKALKSIVPKILGHFKLEKTNT